MDHSPKPPEWEEHVGYPRGSRVAHEGRVYEAQAFARSLPNDHDGPGVLRGRPVADGGTWKEVRP